MAIVAAGHGLESNRTPKKYSGGRKRIWMPQTPG